MQESLEARSLLATTWGVTAYSAMEPMTSGSSTLTATISVQSHTTEGPTPIFSVPVIREQPTPPQTHPSPPQPQNPSPRKIRRLELRAQHIPFPRLQVRVFWVARKVR